MYVKLRGMQHAELLSHACTAILIIIEGQFQAFQRLSISKLVLQTVESCFAALK
jgi:hypothetical protein